MAKTKIIGRKSEQRLLNEAFESTEPHLAALYGRRRVGKTFLVRELFRDHLAMELTESNIRLRCLASQIRESQLRDLVWLCI